MIIGNGQFIIACRSCDECRQGVLKEHNTIFSAKLFNIERKYQFGEVQEKKVWCQYVMVMP